MPELLPALAKRRARRAFEPRAVPDDVQALLWQAVSVAPSHGNTQPVRLLVARDSSVRGAVIAALSEGNRSWAPAAPLFVGIGTLPAHGGTVENSDGTTRDFWAFHAGVAVSNLMAQATELGLIAHPMANFDEVAARAAFRAPAELRIMVLVAIGYPGDPASLPEDLQRRETMPQDRIPLANLVVIGRWDDQHRLSARELRDRAKGG